jgi:hypothetical protein
MRTQSRLPVLVTAAITAAVTLLVPTTASAAPPFESVRQFVDASCEGEWSEGTVTVGFSVRSVTDDASIDLFSGGERVAGGFLENVVRRDGLSLAASVPLYSDGEEPAEVGSGDAAVALAVDGEPQTYETVYQQGNVRFTDTQVVTPLSGSGTLQLTHRGAAETVALDCTGAQTDWTERRTQPDAATARAEVGNLWCRGVTADGQRLDMFIEAGDHDVVELFVGDPATISGYTMELTETRGGLSADVPLWDENGEELGTGALQLAVQEVPGERDHFVLRHSTGGQFFVIESLRATGSIQLPGETVPLDCDGERTLVHEVTTTPAGPGATGPVPANDSWEGAVPLEVGDRATARTRAAAPEAEVPIWCYEVPPEHPDLLPGHTVWYSFAGTGGDVTVSSAGSDHNTVLAVYRVSESEGGLELAEIACADDTFREGWHGTATVGTEAGEQYLVQVGGFMDQSGLVKIALT